MKINLSENEIAVLIKCIDSAIMSWIRHRFDLLPGKINEKRRLEGISLNELKEKFCKALVQTEGNIEPKRQIIKSGEGNNKMASNGVNRSEKLHKLGNKNRMTDYNLQCVNCRKERNLNLVAHRNEKKYITGFVVVCNDCL